MQPLLRPKPLTLTVATATCPDPVDHPQLSLKHDQLWLMLLGGVAAAAHDVGGGLLLGDGLAVHEKPRGEERGKENPSLLQQPCQSVGPEELTASAFFLRHDRRIIR
jgi:hypothetical protein